MNEADRQSIRKQQYRNTENALEDFPLLGIASEDDLSGYEFKEIAHNRGEHLDSDYVNKVGEAARTVRQQYDLEDVPEAVTYAIAQKQVDQGKDFTDMTTEEIAGTVQNVIHKAIYKGHEEEVGRDKKDIYGGVESDLSEEYTERLVDHRDEAIRERELKDRREAAQETEHLLNKLEEEYESQEGGSNLASQIEELTDRVSEYIRRPGIQTPDDADQDDEDDT